MKIRKGFTLVELLVVIVITGILAGAMLLSTGSATDSAIASTIITDMRNLKTAVIMHYGDSMDHYRRLTTVLAGTIDLDLLRPYMDNPAKLTDDRFEVVVNETTNRWWIQYNFAPADTEGVRQKLEGRAIESGLYASINSYDEGNKYVSTGEDSVFMPGR